MCCEYEPRYGRDLTLVVNFTNGPTSATQKRKPEMTGSLDPCSSHILSHYRPLEQWKAYHPKITSILRRKDLQEIACGRENDGDVLENSKIT